MNNEIYNDLIKKFLKQQTINNKDQCLLVFKGFPLYFYRALDQADLTHIEGFWDGNYPDIQSINKTNLIKGLMDASNTQWLFYEEFSAVAHSLNDFSIYPGKIIIINNDLFDQYYPIPVADDSKEIIKLFSNENINQEDSSYFDYYSDARLENDTLFLSYINRHFEIDINKKVDEIPFYGSISQIFDLKDNNEKVEIIRPEALPTVKVALQEGKLGNHKYSLQLQNEAFDSTLDIMNLIGSYYNVFFQTSYQANPSVLEEYNLLSILKKYWGEDAEFLMRRFYKDPAISYDIINISQKDIIQDILNQCKWAQQDANSNYSDIIVTAPTGAGKSLFFQLPGIYLHENYQLLTVVISPLVSLMEDQVRELNERGVTCTTYINSNISYEDRRERLKGIQNGQYSIVYLSPELFLSYDLRSLFGERKIGLLVVDEAHLVTSWGRDFRVDYWFLGDYIEKIRKGSYYSKNGSSAFPVLCLTATAVYGGEDDVIGDLQDSLHLSCYKDHLYFGYVKRDNIEFIVNHPSKSVGSAKEEKLNLSVKAAESFIKDNQKSIIYCPYTTQVQEIKTALNKQELINPREYCIYFGSLKPFIKQTNQQQFSDSTAKVMIATKAFGMGINIPDVTNVYHYAPTGMLSDYVQEVGRAARKLKKGYAITDYLAKDMSYAQTLWGLSGLKQYQLKEILKKLHSIYSEKHSRNLLISPETFLYLFDSKEIENKLKSALMLLTADLNEKYHFKVITVRPKSLFAKQYIVVPISIENSFLKKYGKYCKTMNDSKPQYQLPWGKSDKVTTVKLGNVYEIDLGSLWETSFSDLTFSLFKYKFFNGELFAEDFNNPDDLKIIPNMRLVIKYDQGYEKTQSKFYEFAEAIQTCFKELYSEHGRNQFSLGDFNSLLNANLNSKVSREYASMILDIFCYYRISPENNYTNPEIWKFIFKNKDEQNRNSQESYYQIRGSRWSSIGNNLRRWFKECEPNVSADQYIAYLSIPQKGESISSKQLLISLLQLMDIATCELSGGRNPEIFVRINDPLKIQRLSDNNSKYSNNILRGIQKRHKRAAQIMTRFLGQDYSNNERWTIIENYFLGHDDLVDAQLGIIN